MCDPNYKPKGTDPKKIDTAEGQGLLSTIPVSLHSTSDHSSGSMVLLQTATAWATGASSTAEIRILFDGGSQRSFITENMSRTLGCNFMGLEELNVEGFGGKSTKTSFGRISLKLTGL